MADTNNLRDKVISTIYPNGQGAINAADHQALLLDMVGEMDKTNLDVFNLSENKADKLSIPTKLSDLEQDIPISSYDDTEIRQEIAELSAEVGKKQDTITDLATIRSGAAKGATALQSVPATYATKTDVSNAIAAAITTTLNEEV